MGEEKTEEEGQGEMDHGPLGNVSARGYVSDGAVGAQSDGAAGDAVPGVQGDSGIEDLSQVIQTEGIASETETAGVQTGGFSLDMAAGVLPQGEAQQETQEEGSRSKCPPQVETISKFSFAQMYSKKEPAGPRLVAPVDTTAIDR